MAALLQKIQTLAYEEYASGLNFFCALPSWFLNDLREGFIQLLLMLPLDSPVEPGHEKGEETSMNRIEHILSLQNGAVIVGVVVVVAQEVAL